MSKLFILGTGFSKAVFPNEMPLMKDLTNCVEDELNKFPDKYPQDSAYRKFGNDVEGLMSYLYEEIPWRPDSDSKSDEGLLLKLLDCIGKYVAECEEKAFKGNSYPLWAKRFVKYLHDKKLTVATFNYDTILERLSKNLRPRYFGEEEENMLLDLISIYRVPMASLVSRVGSNIFSDGESVISETYRLLKLHGSINWYFAREMNFAGVPVYYKEVNERDWGELQPKYDNLVRKNKMGLKPLIIPPVAEKSSFYGNQLVKILWAELKEAVDDADEIYCVGYSLPKSDYTTQAFFKTVINKIGRKVYVVNLKSGSDDLIKNYRKALPKCILDEKYIRDDDPVEKMVMDLK